MSRQKARAVEHKAASRMSATASADGGDVIETAEQAKREKYFSLFIIVILFGFGVYNSVLYFGHQAVPNSDFAAFARQGHELLSLKMPGSFKRAPVLGLLIASLSHVVGGRHPDLTAGWLLNAVLYPFNLILLYLVGRRLFGRSAFWVAVIIIINPRLLQSLADPIVETTLVFFTLLTVYSIFARSKWRYVLASLTMMTRYEGAALIMAAFVMDVIYLENRRQRVLAFLYSAIASIPLVLWMLGTLLNWERESLGHGHYLDVLFSPEYTKMFDAPVGTRTGVVKNMGALWGVGFQPLLMPCIGASRDSFTMLWSCSKFFAFAGFLFGSVYGLFKRNWKILVLLVYVVPYMCLHSVFQAILPRYYVPVFWMAILVSWFGFFSMWEIIKAKTAVPAAVITGLQILIGAFAIIWVVPLFEYLPRLTAASKASVSVVYAAIGLVAVVSVVRLVVYEYRCFARELAILAVVCLVIVSNQFTLAGVVGNGDNDVEFKLLADWYVDHTKPGEKLLCTLAHIVRIYAPNRADDLVQNERITADTPTDFAKACYEQGIIYVAWDSRLGLHPEERYHKLWGMQYITMLSEPRSVGPYEFVTQVRAGNGRFINVFRLKMLRAETAD